jgi:putative tryptophan/tyrosine transport system substrate-binding protein
VIHEAAPRARRDRGELDSVYVEAEGQQPVHLIGVLAATESPENTQALLEGLRERGYVVGGNLQIEYRYSQGRNEQIPALVAELVAFGPEVIVANGTPNAVAVPAGAPTIPLIFVAVGDPVAVGLVESLAHPSGNVTGFSTVVPEGFVGKQLQFLKALVPQASRIAVLINPTNRDQARLAEFGPLLGVELIVVEASNPEQLETAFEAARKESAEGILVLGDALVFTHSAKVAGLADCYRLPAMYLNRRYVRHGGLMSYGPDYVDLWHRAGIYVGRILNGERPGDLPVEQPTRFDLVVNLKTAAALGITVPPSILAQADEVIE